MSGLSDTLRLTILGCGSSPGVPRSTGDWGCCDPSNPKNLRTRTSALVERISGSSGKKTSVVIDTGPDFRQQMLRVQASHIDAVLFTHAHADHTHGINDLRSYAQKGQKKIDIYADNETLFEIKKGFDYCFADSLEGPWSPFLSENLICSNFSEIVIKGEGGELVFQPFSQQHGQITSLGFRVGSIAYCPDVNNFSELAISCLGNLKYLILDALQYERHWAHFSLEEALGWIRRLSPEHAILTHMHNNLDYEILKTRLPDYIEPAYDGMVLQISYP